MEALSLTQRAGLRPASRSAPTGVAFLAAFALVAVGVGAARVITTSFVPVLLDRINHAPALIGVVMLVNAAAGFAVPLAVGVWSDRRRAGRFGRRVPFIVGGTLLTSGGLLAIALDTASSYALLALASAAVYVGLNATATAHRAIVPEGFTDRARPAATSAQEVAMLLGGLAGIAVGGALIDSAPWLLFAAVAVVVPALAAPTVASLIGRPLARPAQQPASAGRSASAHPRDFAAVMRQGGAREVLIAQVLWVMAYAALPAFFILYAREVLDLGAGAASLVLAGLGLLTGLGMLAAGRSRPQHVHPLLLAGAGLLGAGLLSASLAGSAALAAGPFAAAALGFGLVTALGFPYFARFIPAAESGRYSGMYFSVRAIASTVALPLAGLLIEATGSYRLLLVQGGVALLALVPLARAREQHEGESAESERLSAPKRLAAVIPCYGSSAVEQVVRETLRHVDEVVLVDDGSPPELGERIERAAAQPGARLIRLGQNSGKGDAVATGAAALLRATDRPDAIVMVDADGQHPPGRIPDFVAAARDAQVVIGDRRGEKGSMPRVRRLTNFVSSSLLSLIVRQKLPDTQCGMRLYRAEALDRAPLSPGRYEAETRHLKALVREGVSVAWVPIPAVYNGAPSSFRPVSDSARVLRAIFGRPQARRPSLRRPSTAFARAWALRLGMLSAATVLAGALLPLVSSLDQSLFLAINSLGDGPEWLFQALDPHTRNYLLLSLLTVLAAAVTRPRWVLGAVIALAGAAFFSDLLLQSIYLLVDRPRPSEVLGGQALLSHGNNWARIASFPSGHMVVTAAIATAAMSVVPALRAPLWIYVAAVAFTRILFGAHFPLDVAAGTVFGYEVGRFSVALAHAAGLLPSPAPASPLARWWCRIRPGCEFQPGPQKRWA